MTDNKKIGSKRIKLSDLYMKRSLRNNNYNIETALSELVDNSIDAQANNIDIIIPSKDELKSGSRPFLVKDDGTGMNYEELELSFDLGSSRSYTNEDIGFYGSGMKAASAYLSNYTRIKTKKKGDNKIYYAIWDIEEKPLEIDYYSEENENVPNGTKIELFTKVPGSNVKSRFENFSHTQSAYVKKNFGVRYFHALSNQKYLPDTTPLHKLKITVNGDDIHPVDPMYRDDPDTKKNFISVQIEVDGVEYRIDINGYYIGFVKNYNIFDQRGLSAERQGVYLLLSNKYVQLGGGWLGVRQQQHYLNATRIELSIPKELIEYFGVSVNKNSSVDLQESSEENQLSIHSERKKIIDAIKSIINWGDSLDNKKRAENKKLVSSDSKKETEKISAEINKSFNQAGLKGHKNENVNQLPNRKINYAQTGLTKKRPKGLNYDKNYFDIELSKDGDKSNFWRLEKDGKKVVICVNTDHPFYDDYLIGDDSLKMWKFLSTMALAEVDSYDIVTPDDWETIWVRFSFWMNRLYKSNKIEEKK